MKVLQCLYLPEDHNFSSQRFGVADGTERNRCSRARLLGDQSRARIPDFFGLSRFIRNSYIRRAPFIMIVCECGEIACELCRERDVGGGKPSHE